MSTTGLLPILGSTQLLGVIGDPVEHSLSPVMHNAAIQALATQQGRQGVSHVYVPLPIANPDLGTALAGLQAMGCQGFNVTIPHKQAIVPFLESITPIAARIGAVNTVWRTATGWAGTNTDMQGFMAPLQHLQAHWPDGTAVILGNGGAARAIIAGCETLQFQHIQIVGRDDQRLAQLLQDFTPSPAQITLHTWDEITDLLPHTDLLVNTTPIGMAPAVDRMPLTGEAMAQLPNHALVYDLIYTPQPTQLLKEAIAQGYQAIDGLEMLVQQGAAALEIWLGSPPEVDVMRRAAAEILNSRAGEKQGFQGVGPGTLARQRSAPD
ncbi:shikimate dehydrogenase [Lyngbya confervoides]|uniref:Shikimate dehydrogenase (NADP(+)) n=1 Tax=Lyngbya confervoides BDU141951 TaxID=1574623 RepID=A0ABD4T287_9CYAN|nr:shikimate dehydrogenase [Lyngbya confervoides]MCM1982543.1 shikimate dehydrogenase [Lyngbya confervoides BDU141951]